jgi:hypothetical protein
VGVFINGQYGTRNYTTKTVLKILKTKKTTTHTQGGAKSAPFEIKSEQFAQLLQVFKALTQNERNMLLQALAHDEGA